MQQLLSPSLLPLLDNPDTAAGVLPIAAQLAAAAVTGGDASRTLHHHGNGNGNGMMPAASADALLMRMAELLDDRWAAGVDSSLTADRVRGLGWQALCCCLWQQHLSSQACLSSLGILR
jgi:hypothetical protein